MNIRLLVGIASLSSLGGCVGSWGSDNFGCPGMPEGVLCMSARDVYQATNNVDKLTAQSPEKVGDAPHGVQQASAQNVHAQSLPIPAIDKPIPIRSQAKVLRIWFAPWQTENGDLNVPGYAYTEIEPRRWNMGENLVVKQRGAIPFELQASSAQPAKQKNEKAGNSYPTMKTDQNIVTPVGTQAKMPYGQQMPTQMSR